jgi:hypothetical protein
MAIFPPITVRQPRPHDLVDDPVGVCGVGTGFEGVISARVRDNNGRELRQTSIRAGGTGIWGNFQVRIDLPDRLPTARGTLEVFEEAQDGSGRELNKVVVPIVFGPALVDPLTRASRSTRWRAETRYRASRSSFWATRIAGEQSSRPTATRSRIPT